MLVDRNVVVEVRVIGIVDLVEPIDITVEVTGHVVVVMVTISVVEPIVSTDSVMTTVDGLVIGMVFVDRNVVVAVSVRGIVDLVEPIETTVDVTGHVVVVMVIISVVEPIVSTDAVVNAVVGLVMGMVSVDMKAVVEVSVIGIVDFVEPIETTVDVTGQVVVVIVTSLVVELMVSTEFVTTGVDPVMVVVVLGKMGVAKVVNDVVDSISVVSFVTGNVLVVTKVVVAVNVMGTVDVTEP